MFELDLFYTSKLIWGIIWIALCVVIIVETGLKRKGEILIFILCLIGGISDIAILFYNNDERITDVIVMTDYVLMFVIFLLYLVRKKEKGK